MTDEDDGWNDGFRSPSIQSDDDDNDVPLKPMSGNFDLLKELDLSLRGETINNRETPWTIASQKSVLAVQPKNQKETISRVRLDVKDTGLQHDDHPIPPPPPPPISSGRTTTTNKGKYGGTWATTNVTRKKDKSDGPPSPTPEVKVKKPRNSGWYDAMGNPIPTTTNPARKKKIVDKADELMSTQEKKARSKEKAAATRKRNKELKKLKEEAIKFGKLPAGIAPTDEFPIVQGLEKMKDLPTKSKSRKPTAKGSDHGVTNEAGGIKLTAEEINDLVSSIPQARERKELDEEDSVKAKSVRSDELKNKTVDRSVDGIIKHFTDTLNNDQSRLIKYTFHSQKNRPNRPSVILSISSDGSPPPKEYLPTPPEDDDDSAEQPSTITNLPSSVIRNIDVDDENTSSGILPCSSPLDKYNKSSRKVIEPLPFRQGDAEVRDSATAAKTHRRTPNTDPRSVQSYGQKRYLNQFELHLPTPRPSMTSTLNRTPAQSATMKPSSSRYSPEPSANQHKRSASPDGGKEWTSYSANKKPKRNNTNVHKHDKITNRSYFPTNIFAKKPHFSISERQKSPPRSMTGAAKPKLFTPSTLDQDQSKTSLYTIKTIHGEKYGSGAPSKIQVQEEVRYLDRDVQPKYRAKNGSNLAGPSDLKRSNTRPIDYRCDRQATDPSKRYKQGSQNSGFIPDANPPDGSNGYTHFDGYSNSERSKPRLAQGTHTNERIEQEDWTQAWTRPAQARPRRPVTPEFPQHPRGYQQDDYSHSHPEAMDTNLY
ncbi:uncharacterized protein IL334_002749 [Kwoniella shivajii]|uniref:Uncharacterized protein n=1 Tax=Kwoniella shivajii TaxID=564305 RepID=A0ABZ1CVK6_9TREE|nr:hypothetical protein IL334_002749 [Kwoniella shivajii]